MNHAHRVRFGDGPGRADLIDRLGPSGRRIVWSLLVVVSGVALISFGGQLLLGPFLIPAQWFAARRSKVAGRVLFTALALSSWARSAGWWVTR